MNRADMDRELSQLAKERDRLKAQAAEMKAELTQRSRQQQVDKAAQEELARNVTQLQEENALLKEDITFLRNLMSAGGTPDGLSLTNLKIEPDAQPDEYRYRMLLLQGGQRKNDFSGKAQIVVKFIHNGVQMVKSMPEDADLRGAPGEFTFRFYQRIEGRFKLPAGAALGTVQVRIFEMPSGHVKLTRNINIS